MKVSRLAIFAAAVAVLAVPAGASAHPSVYTGVATIDLDPAPGPFTPGTQIRHVVTNHGYTTVLRETNGVLEAAHKGVMSYALLPGDLRAILTQTEELATSSGAQAHATCNVAALNAEPAVLGWQGTDPFYNYVPFQKAAAGLDDNPADWIAEVQTLTGVNLAQVSDVPAEAATQLETLCESAAPAGLGGTFVPADQTQNTIASLASGSVTHATAPLMAEITQLKTFTEQLEAQKAAAQSATAAAQAEVARLQTQLRLAPIGNQSGARVAAQDRDVKVTGPAGMRVTLRLRLTSGAAKAIGWKSLVLDKETATIGQDSTAVVDFTLDRRARTALRKAKSSGVYFTARSGDRWATTLKR
jgi:hypothetical protein